MSLDVAQFFLLGRYKREVCSCGEVPQLYFRNGENNKHLLYVGGLYRRSSQMCIIKPPFRLFICSY
jgi:hypothetical protein